MQYRKSELYKLEGPELMRLMNNIQKMYEAIDAVANEKATATQKINKIYKSIDEDVKFLITKKVIGISSVISLTIAALTWLIEFIGRWIESRMQGENLFEGISAAAIKESITEIVPEAFRVYVLIFVIVFFIVYFIKWKDDKYKGKVKSAVWDNYADEWALEMEKACKADDKYKLIKEQGIYEIAEIIIPESFQDYRGVCELIQVMHDYRAYNISQAVAIVKEERYRRDVIEEQRRQNEELARIARQQEEQARRAEQYAQEAERYREMAQAAKDAAYSAERAARAEEEQARIARDMEWEYWHH